MNRKYYLRKIEKFNQVIKEIGVQLEDERRNSNDEEASIRTELLNKQRHYQNKISNIKEILRGNSGYERLSLGHRYTISGNGLVKNLILVMPEEANPVEGFISTKSPLGRMLVGKRNGDEVQIETPLGQVVYKVIAVNQIFD